MQYPDASNVGTITNPNPGEGENDYQKPEGEPSQEDYLTGSPSTEGCSRPMGNAREDEGG